VSVGVGVIVGVLGGVPVGVGVRVDVLVGVGVRVDVLVGVEVAVDVLVAVGGTPQLPTQTFAGFVEPTTFSLGPSHDDSDNASAVSHVICVDELFEPTVRKLIVATVIAF
jgi:hypothetical protein